MSLLTTFEVQPLENEPKVETLSFNKNRAKGVLKALHFIDKSTLQHIVYFPSFEISGYGDSMESAEEMATESLCDLFKAFVSMSPKKRDIELVKMGWRHPFFRNKQYSKMFVDVNGQLKNFNALEDKVEVLKFEAA